MPCNNFLCHHTWITLGASYLTLSVRDRLLSSDSDVYRSDTKRRLKSIPALLRFFLNVLSVNKFTASMMVLWRIRWRIYKSEWVETVKTTLNNSVFSGLWFNQSLPCFIEVCEHSKKIRIKGQFIQK